MSDLGESPKPDEAAMASATPAAKKRQAAAEAVTELAALGDQVVGDARQVVADAIQKPLNTLAPDQGNVSATPEAIQRAAGRLTNDMVKPGPSLIEKIIRRLSGRS